MSASSQGVEKEKPEIEKIRVKIDELEQQRENLEFVYEKIIRLIGMLDSENEQRIRKLESLGSSSSGKYGTAYSEGMTGYVRGAEYTNVLNGISASKAKLKKQIEDTDTEIETLKEQLASHQASFNG